MTEFPPVHPHLFSKANLVVSLEAKRDGSDSYLVLRIKETVFFRTPTDLIILGNSLKRSEFSLLVGKDSRDLIMWLA